MNLQEAQKLVRDYAPGTYYENTYCHHEAQYLPALFEMLSEAPRKRVLEIGPGWGTTMVWLAASGWPDITVMDLMPKGHWITNDLLKLTGARYLQHDICSGPIDEEFDLVIMTQVIGHLKFSPLQALGNVRRMFPKGGKFIASVADQDAYPALREAATYGDDWRAVPTYGTAPPDPAEVQTSYNLDTWRDLMDSAFERCAVWRSGIVLFGEADL